MKDYIGRWGIFQYRLKSLSPNFLVIVLFLLIFYFFDNVFWLVFLCSLAVLIVEFKFIKEVVLKRTKVLKKPFPEVFLDYLFRRLDGYITITMLVLSIVAAYMYFFSMK